MKRKIIIDTDPGQDDAIALMMAMGASAHLNIVGVIAVAGNAELDQTFDNARRIIELADPNDTLGLTVYRGSRVPLVRPLETCQGFHGKNGLADIVLPTAIKAAPLVSGIDFLASTLEASIAGDLTICMLGPLTDLAFVLQQERRLAKNIAELIFMGGAYGPHGNITPAAEFNMYVDPEAANLVIETLADLKIPITVMPLDVTHQAVAAEDTIIGLREAGTKSASLAAEILATWGTKPHYTSLGGKPIHDPCVIAYLLEPDLFEGRKVNLQVETQGPLD